MSGVKEVCGLVQQWLGGEQWLSSPAQAMQGWAPVLLVLVIVCQIEIQEAVDKETEVDLGTERKKEESNRQG